VALETELPQSLQQQHTAPQLLHHHHHRRQSVSQSDLQKPKRPTSRMSNPTMMKPKKRSTK
jgi:hypothetical protein